MERLSIAVALALCCASIGPLRAQISDSAPDWTGTPLVPAFTLEEPPPGGYLTVQVTISQEKRSYPFCFSSRTDGDGRVFNSSYIKAEPPYEVTDLHGAQSNNMKPDVMYGYPFAVYTAMMHRVSDPSKSIPLRFVINKRSPNLPTPADLPQVIRANCFETVGEFNARHSAVTDTKGKADETERQERLAAAVKARLENFAGVSVGQNAAAAVPVLQKKGYQGSWDRVTLQLQTAGQANYTALYDPQGYYIDEHKRSDQIRDCLVRSSPHNGPVGMVEFFLDSPASQKKYKVNLCMSPVAGEVKDVQSYLSKAIIIEVHAYVWDGTLHTDSDFAKQAQERYPGAVDGTKVSAVREGVTVFSMGDRRYTTGVDIIHPDFAANAGHIEIVIRNDIDHEKYDASTDQNAKDSWAKARSAISY